MNPFGQRWMHVAPVVGEPACQLVGLLGALKRTSVLPLATNIT
jgi:hypothetical protein